MAAKIVKKPAPQKVAAAVLKTAAPASASLADLTRTFPQFKPFKMETNMFKGNAQMDKMAQDATMFSQDYVDGLVKSTTIFAKGMEDIIKTCMEICQDAGEKGQNAAKSVMACKTLNEFTDVQTRLAQSSFDEFMTNATRLSEKAVKICTDCMEPINDQMGKSMKRANDSMAA